MKICKKGFEQKQSRKCNRVKVRRLSPNSHVSLYSLGSQDPGQGPTVYSKDGAVTVERGELETWDVSLVCRRDPS